MQSSGEHSQMEGRVVMRVWRRTVGALAMIAFLCLASPNVQIAEASQRTEPLPVLHATGYAHVEVDLTRQRLFVVDDFDRVVKTLPVSSGTSKWFTSEGRRRRAITPRGEFTVYRKIAGWRKS